MKRRNKQLLAENEYVKELLAVLKENPSDEEFRKLVLCCPAALYKVEDDGSKRFDYAGCLECGTCRMICGETILEKWEYPQPTMGIEYRFG